MKVSMSCRRWIITAAAVVSCTVFAADADEAMNRVVGEIDLALL